MGADLSIDDGDYEPVLPEFTLDAIADRIKNGEAKKIVCMTGAGISVAAGIPDFRSPDTGLYAQLEAYDLPNPQAVFELGFFRQNPKPFFKLSKALFPSQYNPTPVHAFIALLKEKGVLHRVYSQNIDGLERIAGLTEEDVVECHGTYATARCLKCAKKYPSEFVRKQLFEDDVEVVSCTAKRKGSDEEDATCDGVVKPDIVFFGESLPTRFAAQSSPDLKAADLLIILGTSLTVMPFASLATYVGRDVPRLVINNVRVGEDLGLRDGKDNNYRDVFAGGDCQETVETFAEKLGWAEDFKKVKEKCGAKISPPPAPVQVPGLAKKGDDEVQQATEKLQHLKVSDEKVSNL
eukprot:TRINITY_DN57682_c0_g1_i1.p1 TRINITY_DN57682_c0_g1~~TRINITY_DN57682_c0_g1_i1.p1  ORF type:complete len:350 (+),score=44.49 TRINITY_DN57682_c0_g1_i1:67-1116(+)